jgi:hypothetical protein
VTSTDAFALKNSSLYAFLYADVGIEANGPALTIVSILARLGQDPWAEAARWTTLPKAAAIAILATSIGKMPLDQRALDETNVTASRLFLLLPVRVQNPGQPFRSAIAASAALGWVPVAFLCLSLIMGLAVSMTSARVTPAGTPTAPVARKIDRAAAIQSK